MDDEVAAYYIFLSLMQALVLLLTISKDSTIKNIISDRMLALSTAFDGRLFASRDVWSLPRRGGWWHEMRYTRVNWGERDTFEHDFRMKRQTFQFTYFLKYNINFDNFSSKIPLSF
jgi:hypothetical protein